MALLLGCMMPMSTMLAAETEAETGAGSADGDVVYGDETAADIGDAASEENGSAPDGEMCRKPGVCRTGRMHRKPGVYRTGRMYRRTQTFPAGRIPWKTGA